MNPQSSKMKNRPTGQLILLSEMIKTIPDEGCMIHPTLFFLGSCFHCLRLSCFLFVFFFQVGWGNYISHKVPGQLSFDSVVVKILIINEQQSRCIKETYILLEA